MPDLSLPEIRLPDVKLPEGLRDMNRHDIQEAINDRMPKKIEMPEIDLSKVDLSKVELPKAVADRLPGRKRTNPILPIAAFLAIGSLIAAAWWLITSPTASLRIRETADRIRAKVAGPETAVERYDDDTHLGSLLPTDDSQTRPSVEAETWPESASLEGVAQPVGAGNGSSKEKASSV